MRRNGKLTRWGALRGLGMVDQDPSPRGDWELLRAKEQGKLRGEVGVSLSLAQDGAT